MIASAIAEIPSTSTNWAAPTTRCSRNVFTTSVPEALTARFEGQIASPTIQAATYVAAANRDTPPELIVEG